MAQRKAANIAETGLKKPKITVQMSPPLKDAYELAGQTAILNAGRMVCAGFLWMLENPEFRQHAADGLADFEQNGPKTRKEVLEWIRAIHFKHFGQAIRDLGGSPQKAGPSGRGSRPAGNGNNSAA